MTATNRRRLRPASYVSETRAQRIVFWTVTVLVMAVTAWVSVVGAQSTGDHNGVVPGRQMGAVIVRQLHLGPLVEIMEHRPAQEPAAGGGSHP